MELLDILTAMAKTGRLGPVSIGTDWDEVTAALGEPWDIGTLGHDAEWPRLFAYGDLELSVCQCRRVAFVFVQTWRDTVELPPSVAGGAGVFPGLVSYADVTSALGQADCPWQPNPALTFADQCSLTVTSSGAGFTFEIPEGADPLLNIVDLPGDGHDCAG
ncbi:hypothetical protein [Streptomyces laurentii]|uniref:hypothetical protein n=1 Tax=Streptomyces laurentii TaxID=39478 RepID=UPI0033E1D530